MSKEKLNILKNLKLDLDEIPSKIMTEQGLIIVRHASHYIDVGAEFEEVFEFRKKIEDQIRVALRDPDAQIFIMFDPTL